MSIASAPTENREHTDAIIVFTGSGERIPEAIKLLNDGAAEKLLISGVGKTTRTAELLDSLAIGWRELLKMDLNKISLGYEATDTVGNANESESWVRKNKVESVRLVTSNYHMPRAHLEFRKRIHDVKVIEHPVIPGNFDKTKWQDDKATRDRIIKEYFKYLYSWLGLNEKNSD